MSFEVLETVYRQSRFRRSLNASKKKRIRKFVSDTRRKRFTLRTFRNATHLGMITAPFLDAVVEESEALGKAISPDAHSFLLRKSNNFFCPNEDHVRLILEPDEDANGWCYICEESYPLDDTLESEVVFTSNVEASDSSEMSETGTYSAVKKRWHSLPLPVRWLLVLLLGAALSEPVSVALSPFFEQLFWPTATNHVTSPRDQTEVSLDVSTSSSLRELNTASATPKGEFVYQPTAKMSRESTDFLGSRVSTSLAPPELNTYGFVR